MAKSHYRLTVIVPTYNSELTIRRCIDSLLNQEEPAQLILVDDGSSDETVDIIKHYHADNLTLISTSHVGPSMARNLGLKNVITEWVTFVDSDDYVDADYTKSLLSNLREGVLLSMCEQHGKDIIPKKYSNNVDFIDDLVSDKINSSVWGKLFNMNIIRNKNIKFDEELFLAEDTLFCIAYALSCQGVYVLIKAPKYYYMNRNNSLSSLFSMKNNDVVRAFNLIKAYKRILILVNKKGSNSTNKLVRLRMIVFALNYYRKAKLNNYDGEEKNFCHKLLLDNLKFTLLNGSIKLKLKLLITLMFPRLIGYLDKIRYTV